MTEEEVQSLLQRFNTAEEDITKLNTALRNLKIWTGNIFWPVSNKISNKHLHLKTSKYGLVQKNVKKVYMKISGKM